MRHRITSLLRVVARPCADLVLTLTLATVGVVMLLDLAPGTVADVLGDRAVVGELADAWCIGCTWYEQVAQRLWSIAHLDLGVSWTHRRGAPVDGLVGTALGRSARAVAVGVVLAFALAAASVFARRRGGLAGRLVVGGVRWVSAVPAFLVAIVIWRLGATLYGFDHGVLHTVTVGALLALADAGFADLSRRLESELRHAEDQPHVVAARANGDRPRRMVARTMAAPIAEQVAARVSLMLGAVMMIEIPLQTHGIGQLFAEAAARRDLPLVVGCTVALAAVVAGVHAVKQVVIGLLDPQHRWAGESR